MSSLYGLTDTMLCIISRSRAATVLLSYGCYHVLALLLSCYRAIIQQLINL